MQQVEVIFGLLFCWYSPFSFSLFQRSRLGIPFYKHTSDADVLGYPSYILPLCFACNPPESGHSLIKCKPRAPHGFYLCLPWVWSRIYVVYVASGISHSHTSKGMNRREWLYIYTFRVDRGELSHGASCHNGSLNKLFTRTQQRSLVLEVSVNANSFSVQCSMIASAALTRDRVLHFLPLKKKFYSLNFHVIDIEYLFQCNRLLYYLKKCFLPNT